MITEATPGNVPLNDQLGPLPPKTALGWDYGYTDQQMREYAAGEIARATATLNACLLQMQEAAKDLAAKAAILAPHRKLREAKRHAPPKKLSQADRQRLADLEAAHARGASMLSTYARLLLQALRAQTKFTEQERELLAEVAGAMHDKGLST